MTSRKSYPGDGPRLVSHGGRPTVDAGGGGGDDGGMDDTRITNLEADMRDARDRLGRVESRLYRVDARLGEIDVRLGKVEVRLDSLEGKVDGLPSKDFVRAEVMSASNRIVYWVIGASVFAPLMPQITSALKTALGH